jgi:hypothetical protein
LAHESPCDEHGHVVQRTIGDDFNLVLDFPGVAAGIMAIPHKQWFEKNIWATKLLKSRYPP